MGSWTSAGTHQVVPKVADNWTDRPAVFQIMTWKKRLFGSEYSKATKFNLSEELFN